MQRLLRPAQVAVVGGHWALNVIAQLQRGSYRGAIWPVHPRRRELGGLRAYAEVAQLPAAPDAAFVGVNCEASIEVVAALAARGAGGAVCFASGFAEAAAEDSDGPARQGALLAAAGTMALLGPNCYGYVNALDGVALWPDQHGLARCARGVALIAQSSNVLLNLSMQARGLPIAYALSIGNGAQIGVAQLADALLDDERVSAIGLVMEGAGEPAALHALALRAQRRAVPLVVLKLGRSVAARSAMLSHTSSLAGSDAGASALFERLGIPRVNSLEVLLQTLAIWHAGGPLRGAQLTSLSCSGGEAGLMADAAGETGVRFAPLTAPVRAALREALGPRVALANPLDYHTYIWGDRARLQRAYTALMAQPADLHCLLLDFPRADRCQDDDWAPALDAWTAAAAASGARAAVLASLADNLPEARARALLACGIAALSGIHDGQRAIAAAAGWRAPAAAPPWPPHAADATLQELDEDQAKARLACAGLALPRARRAADVEEAVRAAAAIGWPVVLKGIGAAHKSEAGLVRLNLHSGEAVRAAAAAMHGASGFLLEQQIAAPIAELLIGVVHDPAHGWVLTLAAGGVDTEWLCDARSLLLPATDAAIEAALDALRLAPKLRGWRGAPAVDRGAIVRAVQAVCACADAHRERLAEIEVNPLLCLAEGAVAVDALMRLHTKSP